MAGKPVYCSMALGVNSVTSSFNIDITVVCPVYIHHVNTTWHRDRVFGYFIKLVMECCTPILIAL